MVHAHAALPRFELDGKRIVATSGVIALHLAVLMMLMMPMHTAQTAPEVEEQPPIYFPDIIKIPPPIPPPIARVDPKPTPPTHNPPVRLEEPPVEPFNDTANALDFKPPPLTIEPPRTFGGGDPPASSFAQLSADIAPAPPYPRPAIARRLTGTVTLRIHVDASGKPMEVMVENSSGSPILDQAALKFVKARWHFVPATQDGVAIEAWALVPIEYVLN